MFAYCRNNPASRMDISGYADIGIEEKFDDDVDIGPNDKELGGKSGDGGSSGSSASTGGLGGGGSSGGSASGGGNGSTSAGGAQSGGKGFSSFGALKNYLGSAGTNNHWHHIVEQCQTQKSGFSSEQVNNTSNVVAVDAQTHAQITGYYNSTKFEFTGGLSVRNWLAGQPFQFQFDFGINVLRTFGVTG